MCKRIFCRLLRFVTASDILYRTVWYKNLFVDPDHHIYPDNDWYRKHEERNYDLVNLGSSSAKWAYCYNDFGVKAMNWAQQPQTLLEDFNLLRTYHSILRKNGYVLITIMPFSGLNKETSVYDAIKYLKLNTQDEAIEPVLFDKAKRYAKYPILFGKPAVKALIHYISCKEVKDDRLEKWSRWDNPLSENELKADAKHWMDNWKVQFGISDFEAPLTEENRRGREYRIDLMRALIDFCTERSYQPVLVIPPVTEYLAKEFTQKFSQIYIYDFLEQIRRNVKILNYSEEKSLMEKDYYVNSFFMNRRGSKVFTDRVLKDLKLI